MSDDVITLLEALGQEWGKHARKLLGPSILHAGDGARLVDLVTRLAYRVHDLEEALDRHVGDLDADHGGGE